MQLGPPGHSDLMLGADRRIEKHAEFGLRSFLECLLYHHARDVGGTAAPGLLDSQSGRTEGSCLAGVSSWIRDGLVVTVDEA